MKVGDIVEITGVGGRHVAWVGNRARVVDLRPLANEPAHRVQVDTTAFEANQRKEAYVGGMWWGHFDLRVVPQSELVADSWNLRPYSNMTTKELRTLHKATHKELGRRFEALKVRREVAQVGFQGLANFMAGVTWALACRAVLRWSKGHQPVGGKAPMDGSPWTPLEIIRAGAMYEHRSRSIGKPPPTCSNPLVRLAPPEPHHLAKVMKLVQSQPPPVTKSVFRQADVDYTY